MAVGYIAEIGLPLDQGRNTAPDAVRGRYERHEGLDLVKAIVGPFTGTQPVELVWWASPGYIERSFFEDFYNRVYLLPSVIDYKAVATDSFRNYDVWNAWLKPTTVEAVIQFETDGTEITGPASGLTFDALEIRRFVAMAKEDGPAEFEAIYRFDFDTLERRELILIGERARRLPASPAWGGANAGSSSENGFSISYEFKTDIITSRSGKEQRRADRQTPRRNLSYSAMAWAGGARAFNRHMRDWQNRVVVVPEEPTFVRLTSLAAFGTSVLAVDRIPSWLQVGSAVFVRGEFEDVLTEVTDIAGLAVTIGSPLPFVAVPSSKVLLAAYGRMKAELTSVRETSTAFVTEIVVDVTPASDMARVPPEPEIMLAGRPVFDMRPNWGGRPNVTYMHPRETLDYGQGRIQIFQPIEFSNRRTDWTFSGRTAKLEKVIDHFILMKGRQGEFYFPTWERDLPVQYALAGGTRTMSFDTSEVYDAYNDDPIHRGVAILLDNGAMVYNAMREDMTLGDGKTLLTFENEWARTYSLAEIVSISWLYVCRFATDKIEVEWLTNEAGQTKLSFITLESRPLELLEP